MIWMKYKHCHFRRDFPERSVESSQVIYNPPPHNLFFFLRILGLSEIVLRHDELINHTWNTWKLWHMLSKVKVTNLCGFHPPPPFNVAMRLCLFMLQSCRLLLYCVHLFCVNPAISFVYTLLFLPCFRPRFPILYTSSGFLTRLLTDSLPFLFRRRFRDGFPIAFGALNLLLNQRLLHV